MIIDTDHIPASIGATTLRLLCLLAELGPQRLSDLATHLGITTAALTGQIDRSEQSGWVRRVPVPEDRRVFLAELTDEGRALVNGLRAGWRPAAESPLPVNGREILAYGEIRTETRSVETGEVRLLESDPFLRAVYYDQGWRSARSGASLASDQSQTVVIHWWCPLPHFMEAPTESEPAEA